MRYENLRSMFSDIASAIREKDGIPGRIRAEDFASRIRAIPIEVNADMLLIGRYTFTNGNGILPKEEYSAGARHWLKNDVNGDYCEKLEQTIDLSESNYKFQVSTDDVRIGWPDNHNLKLSASCGFQVAIPEKTGIILDATPSGNNFTVIFKIMKDGNDEAHQYPGDILYIGPIEGSTDSKKYFRLYRPDGSSFNHLRANCGSGYDDTVLDIDNIFSSTNQSTVSLVFQDDKVTAYMRDKIVEQPNNDMVFADEQIYIMLNAVQTEYADSAIYIDDICVIDAALSQTQLTNFLMTIY